MDTEDFLTEGFLNEACNNIAAKTIEPGEYSPLGLAHIGDAVFELLARSKAVAGGNMPVNKLSGMARGYVNATAQSKFYGVLETVITPDELAIMKRGRNTKSNSQAKNAKTVDYRRATGVEALFGYLFLSGQNDRIMELFSMIGQ